MTRQPQHENRMTGMKDSIHGPGTKDQRLRSVPRFILLLLVFGVCLSSQGQADFQGATHITPFDEDTIAYSKTKANGPVARLQARIDSGEVHLNYDPAYGYLLSFLDAMKVSTNSQMLVFSKTSFQRERISPESPRSIFFNDDVYVGFIPGAPLMEVSMADPKLGAVFYTLPQTRTDRPRLTRTDQCLECHASAKTLGVPGHLVRSFMTDDSGGVDLASGVSIVNHRTPIEERWGGWYVTGTHGSQTHRGNLIGKSAFEQQEKQPNYLGNLTDLSGFVDLRSYATRHSDIVALMVLEHQTHMHNFITRLNYEATLALLQYGHVSYLKSMSEAFLKYLLFVEEAPIRDPIIGDSQFSKTFSAEGPRDKQGRSLRDFDLEKRLFKYPCSYLIYSASFEQLPLKMKEYLYRRLYDILSGSDTSSDFEKISPATKGAILDILRETKTGLPDYWRDGSHPVRTEEDPSPKLHQARK